eukprot:TRINITY_DN109430_c0_g1_i1.p1 TRINITY_DN109430_c0_g1~~TRINITY_DN109430_c0_g1_i1.p1  ORF type:complete len:256 (+),score=57.23 TRINITY_DN109430_c0_g1_i1:152-919(+)
MALEVRIYGFSSMFRIFAEKDWRVKDVKEAVAPDSGIPVHEQRLLVGLVEPGDLEKLEKWSDGEVLELSIIRRPPEQAQWLEAVSEDPDGTFLSEAPEHIRSDREVILAAVRHNGRALEFASGGLQADAEVVLNALEEDSFACNYIAEELWATREVVLAAVRRRGIALRHAVAELLGDREVVLAAVARDGLALQYASANLRSDYEVVLAAVEENGEALQYAEDELRIDSGLLRIAWGEEEEEDSKRDVGGEARAT